MAAVSEDKKALFETMPIPQALTKMAIPTIISQLISLIYNLVDTFFIGRCGNSYMMASVTLAFTIFMMLTALANLFGIGGGSLIARLNGKHDSENAKIVSSYSVYGAVFISLAYALLIAVTMEPLLNLLGASEATMGFAKQYVWIVVVAGSLPIILSQVFAHLLRNSGYAKQASLGLSLGGVLNMGLDPLFMFVLLPDGMQVFGAALATTIANVVSCIYLLMKYRQAGKSGAPLTMKLSHVRQIRPEDRKSLFAVGVPSAVLTGLFDVANIFLNRLMAGHGDLELAAIGIVMKAERLPNAINLGICQGMLPIVAYNFSSGNRQRMNDTITFARKCGLIICAFSMVFFELLATPIIKLFMSTSTGDVANSLLTIGFATTFIRIRCLASPVQFLNYSSSFCLQAMGAGKETLIHAVFRELVFYIPFMFLLNWIFGTYGLAAALIAGEGCGAVFAIIILNRFLKKHSITM